MPFHTSREVSEHNLRKQNFEKSLPFLKPFLLYIFGFMQLSLMFHSVVFSLNINKFVVAVFRKCKMCFDKVDFIA